MTTPLAVPAARTCPHTPPCTLGADLHEGSVVVDVKGDGHRIDHFRDYPGQYKGDTARRAYDAGETWRVTVGDHEHFHALPEEKTMHTAVIRIGTSSSQLLILDAERRGPSLNLVWGYGGGDGTPQGRADVLLAQNGYRRTGDWETSREGDIAPVEAVEATGECSCWWDDQDGKPVLANINYWCAEHPELRERSNR